MLIQKRFFGLQPTGPIFTNAPPTGEVSAQGVFAGFADDFIQGIDVELVKCNCAEGLCCYRPILWVKKTFEPMIKRLSNGLKFNELVFYAGVDGTVLDPRLVDVGDPRNAGKMIGSLPVSTNHGQLRMGFVSVSPAGWKKPIEALETEYGKSGHSDKYAFYFDYKECIICFKADGKKHLVTVFCVNHYHDKDKRNVFYDLGHINIEVECSPCTYSVKAICRDCYPCPPGQSCPKKKCVDIILEQSMHPSKYILS